MGCSREFQILVKVLAASFLDGCLTNYTLLFQSFIALRFLDQFNVLLEICLVTHEWHGRSLIILVISICTFLGY